MDKLLEWFAQYSKTDIFAISGFIVGIIAYYPYVRDIIKIPEVKPPISSWGLWSTLTVLTFFGQLKTGKVYPQTFMYLCLDPFVFVCACIKRGSLDFDKWDMLALVVGFFSAMVIIFAPQNSYQALIGSLIGIAFANIPVIKNINKNPQVESLSGWLLFTLAGFLSLLSAIVFFTTWLDAVTPITYFSLCCMSTGFLIFKRFFTKK